MAGWWMIFFLWKDSDRFMCVTRPHLRQHPRFPSADRSSTRLPLRSGPEIWAGMAASAEIFDQHQIAAGLVVLIKENIAGIW
jgi:hypothetical protein